MSGRVAQILAGDATAHWDNGRLTVRLPGNPPRINTLLREYWPQIAAAINGYRAGARTATRRLLDGSPTVRAALIGRLSVICWEERPRRGGNIPDVGSYYLPAIKGAVDGIVDALDGDGADDGPDRIGFIGLDSPRTAPEHAVLLAVSLRRGGPAPNRRRPRG